MKAAVLEKLETTPVYKNFEEPVPDNDLQVINVKAAAFKNLDKLKTMKSFYGHIQKLPAVVGTDGVGTLEDGTRVYAQGVTGMFADKALVRKNGVVELPEEIDFATAAALPNAVMGAALPLKLKADIQPGENVIINGATGFTGQMAVQLAKHYGAENIIVTGRNKERLELLKEFGATHVISLSQGGDEIAEELREIMKSVPVDAVIDYLWGESISIILEEIKNAAHRKVRVINVGNTTGDSIRLSTGILRGSGISLIGSGLGSYSKEEFGYFSQSILPEMFKLAAEGRITVNFKEESIENIELVWERGLKSGERTVFVM